MIKKVLFVNRKPPHGTYHAKESQQMAMVLGAFEQTVSLLFMGDGIYALLSAQEPHSIGFENYTKTYASLKKFYDISPIYVEEVALLERGIISTQLHSNTKVIQTKEIQLLFKHQDFIIEI